MRGIEAQFLALQKGFNEIIPQHILRPFDERELEVSIEINADISLFLCIISLCVLRTLLACTHSICLMSVF